MTNDHYDSFSKR